MDINKNKKGEQRIGQLCLLIKAHFWDTDICLRACLYAPTKQASPLSEISPHQQINKNTCIRLYSKEGFSKASAISLKH